MNDPRTRAGSPAGGQGSDTAAIDTPAPLSGFRFHPGYLDRRAQEDLLAAVLQLLEVAPLYRPRMPRSGRPFSVEMSNAGTLGWLSDKQGYRYSRRHPVTGQAWPAMPKALLDAWHELSDCAAEAECCLINLYRDGARMGLHQDRDETDFGVAVVSLSLGDDAVFRIGGSARRGPTRSLKLSSGDAVVLGGASRLAYHGIDRVRTGSSRLVPGGGRINLTLRRVNAVPTDVA